MSKIPIGKMCSICGKIHVIKSLESVILCDRKKIKKLDHRIFEKDYIGSLIKDDEVWEFYGPLVTKEVRIEIDTPESKEEEPIDQAYEGDFNMSFLLRYRR